jgi:hypothetical protein
MDCTVAHGYISFDREFASNLTASSAVVGGWQWTRTFGADPRIVFGVPEVFSSLEQTWCLGYSQITWVSPSQFAPSQEAVSVGICAAYPTSGFTPTVESNKYGETQPSYSAAASTGVNCAPAYTQCSGDVTLLAFQNRDPRDFSKNPTSTLLTGPRSHFCQPFSQEGAASVVFDTLIFVGVPAAQPLSRKRAAHVHHHALHLIYDGERDGLVHARHHPLLAAAVNAELRKRGEANLVDATPIAGAPHRDNFTTTIAAGSVDGSNSTVDGPALRQFPQSYSFPLTLDPVQANSSSEPLIYDGQLVTGVLPVFCTLGELGCTCRDATALSQCDVPLTCNSLNYCVQPACPAGDAGCAAQSDGSCNDPALGAVGGFCQYTSTCTPGALGCTCGSAASCATANAQCLDGLCIVSQMGICASGEAGCPCSSDGSCTGGTACDSLSGMCLFESCTLGAPGCTCSVVAGSPPCAPDFTCTAGACVQTSCAAGGAGCACLPNRQCGVQGYTCVDLSDGTQNACVGEQLCPGGQEQRCISMCGLGDVAVCPVCIYGVVICVEYMPTAYW